jgi:hypothetical protein
LKYFQVYDLLPGVYTAQHENYLITIFLIRSIKVSPLYPKQLYRSVQYGATALKNTTTVCPVHNFPPPSELLVCYQPHRQTAMPGQKSIYETFLGITLISRWESPPANYYNAVLHSTVYVFIETRNVENIWITYWPL